MHTHFSVMSAFAAFLAVAVIGTAWRLGSYHLIASNNPQLAHLGRAMGFQY